MALPKTLEQYINNPTGVKSGALTQRKLNEELYQDKWGKIMTRENGHVDYTLYKSKNVYVAHLKIPSEVVPEFYYDVVLKFTEKKSPRGLENFDIQFFSNDPAFNYTWAFAFKKHKLHIPELEPKMTKLALREPPKTTNPDKTIGYVKTFFFAYIYMKQKGLFNKLRFESEAKPLNWKNLLKLIRETEEVIEERQRLGEEIEKKKRKESKLDTSPRKDDIRHPEITSNANQAIRRVQNIGKVGRSNTSTRSTRTSRIGKTKKVGKR